jgi:hypothetical protein
MNERIMDYTCLQDIFDEIYEADYDGEWAIGREDEFPWREGFQKFATKKGLLEALAYYFKIWDQGERGIAWQEEREGFKEYERASWCFYYAFDATPILKDPSIIPELIQYFLPEGENRWPWSMEDVWTEMMLFAVKDYADFGLPYVAWVMKSFKNLRKGAEWVVEDLMFSMIFDTFQRITPDVFPDLPVVDALPLGDRSMLKKILNSEVQGAQKFLNDSKKKLLEPDLVGVKLKNALEDLESAKRILARTEYVLGQLLALPENVVPLHAAD